MDKNQLALNFETDFVEEDESVFVPKAVQGQILPDNVDTRVIKQYKAGATLKQITRDNGLSYGKVYEILNRMGVKLRHGRYNDSKSGKRITTMSQMEKSSIIEFYRAGFEVKEIMETFTINKHGLYSLLNEAGVPRRNKHQFISLDIAAVREPEIVSVAPQEPPVLAWTHDNILRIIVKKEAFKESINQVSFVVNLADGTLEFKEEN